MRSRSKQVRNLVKAIEMGGSPVLIRAVARMIDPDGPSAECIQATDDAMNSAADEEQYYDAALGMAACLREQLLAPEPEEPEEPEESEDDPGSRPDQGESASLGPLVLAASSSTSRVRRTLDEGIVYAAMTRRPARRPESG